jgi:GT2 family glycosyltransferase
MSNSSIKSLSNVGVVAIGRNEGERLRNCIKSVVQTASVVVYVDSGSTDNSIALARAMGVEVVEIDMSVPFTAARARNAGLHRLRQIAPDIPYVQFVDGDCEVVAGWLENAAQFLEDHLDVVVVCGRRRERYPERSIYNRLCDVEWDTPIGEARACGGDAMFRVSAFTAANGYRNDLIAGEEPELCVRLRGAGGRVWRLGEEMTLHDAAMTRFGQWWNRTKRAGYAFAEGAWIHGSPPERHYVPQARRALLWGVALPFFIIVAGLVDPLCFGLLLLYPLQVLRIALRSRKSVGNIIWSRAFFLVLGRFPEGLGQLSFLFNKISGKRSVLIEYK